eukprot:5284077-Pleurochrysis_carterae.AAC.1
MPPTPRCCDAGTLGARHGSLAAATQRRQAGSARRRREGTCARARVQALPARRWLHTSLHSSVIFRSAAQRIGAQPLVPEKVVADIEEQYKGVPSVKGMSSWFSGWGQGLGLSGGLSGLGLAKSIITIGGRQVRLQRVLAEGGYAVVFAGQDVSTGEGLAVKRIIAVRISMFVAWLLHLEEGAQNLLSVHAGMPIHHRRSL